MLQRGEWLQNLLRIIQLEVSFGAFWDDFY